MQAVHLALELKAEPLRLHLGESAPDGCILLDPRDDEWLRDRELAERMVASEALVLSGGSFLDWYDALLADGRRRRFTSGLFEALRKGTHVIGQGGAAAFLSRGTSIPRSELDGREDSRRRNPRRREQQSPVVGLGLGPPGYIDALAFAGGSPARLMHALDETHIDLGWWIAPNTALLYDYAASSVFVVGPGSACLLDLRRARRGRERTSGARLSVLVAGDGWHRARKRLVLGSGVRPVGALADGSVADSAAAQAALRWTSGLLSEPPAPFSGSLTADADSAWTGFDDAPRPLRLRLDWIHPVSGHAAESGSRESAAGDAAAPR